MSPGLPLRAFNGLRLRGLRGDVLRMHRSFRESRRSRSYHRMAFSAIRARSPLSKLDCSVRSLIRCLMSSHSWGGCSRMRQSKSIPAAVIGSGGFAFRRRLSMKEDMSS